MTTLTAAHPDYYDTSFGPLIERINSELKKVLTETTPIAFEGPQGLWEAMRYGTLNGGKRIRSVLAIETCLALGGTEAAILPTACAIEMLHAQSLIHDDLPCMDNDDLRRGKPTVHKAFNESTAVLSGDALLAMAFGVILKHTPKSNQVTADILLDVINDFSDVGSVEGLVNGQFVDILYEGRKFTPEVLEYIHSYKTGALFVFSTRAGARLAGASAATVEILTQFGEKIGLAFQIVDDLLDIQSTSETLGKTVGKDVLQEKATYPALFGIEASKTKADGLIQEALDLLKTLTAQNPEINIDSLAGLAQFIQVRIH